MSKVKLITPLHWRQARPGPFEAGGSLADRLRVYYSGVPAEPLPDTVDMLLVRLDVAEDARPG